MTKLAIYDKKYKRKDQRKLNYFIEDYIYLKNFKTRLWITFLALCCIGIGALKVIINQIIFPTSIFSIIDSYIKPYIIPWLIGIVLYTAISTYCAGKAYIKVSERFSEYRKYLKELDKYETDQPNEEGETHEVK